MIRLRSLRGRVMMGAILWTLGLFAVITILLTVSTTAMRSVAIIHAHSGLAAVVAVACMVAGLALVRRALAPLDNMRRRLSEIRAGSARQLRDDYPSEVQPLVDDLNALLAHHELAVGRAVAKAGDLAHGLKTPLAVLAQEAERATALGQHDLAQTMSQQVERMRRQIDYHLAHARAAASGATPGARCSVRASAEGLTRTLLRLHAGRGVAIDVAIAGDQIVRAQREDLDEMLGNLLDNACKWARSRVAIDAAANGAGILITVDDDGPGLEPAMWSAVLQRGVRADEAAPGSGFGLAIVRDLAELYGGAIAIGKAPIGGVRARLELPAG
jgi:signal transduction histidine kinase